MILILQAALAVTLIRIHFTLGLPAQNPTSPRGPDRVFDIQGHRGGRGNTIENTLPSFAWGLIDGATTLELDNGITKDGVVIVWHDENILAEKCEDTAPAFPDDPDFPYVGKFIANLTLAQVQTLDCGSERQADFPLQLLYPRTRISTLQETFDFVECADPSHQVLWNIESKINPVFPNQTLSVDDFVKKQHALFAASPYRNSIMYQSFDWRTLIAMKDLDPSVVTSALIQQVTAAMPDNSTSPWLAGIRLDSFPGSSLGVQIAEAAYSIKADILSPSARSSLSPVNDPMMPGYITFTTKDMVDQAHHLGMAVKPWTVDRLNIVEQLVDWDVDGVITDYPDSVRRWAQQHGLSVSPQFPKDHILACLKQHTKRAI